MTRKGRPFFLSALYERFIAAETRPERAALRERARASLASLPSPPSSAPPAASSSPAAPAVPLAWRAEAEALFAEGLALARVASHRDAAAKFLAAAARDSGRVDALLRAGLSLRHAGELDGATDAYGRGLAHSSITPEERLDGTYGLAETARLKGDLALALELFGRYVAGETRPAEARFVERARAAIAEIQRGRQPTPPTPPTPPTSPTPPTPPTEVPFFGDALVVDGLVAEASALRATGDDPGAASRLARARAVAPGDSRVPATPPPACDADALLGAGEAALAKQDGPGALLAFQQARACDPTRAAPLWGLARAADVVGDRASAKAHARRYLQARAPDHEPTVARAALFRSEQP